VINSIAPHPEGSNFNVEVKGLFLVSAVQTLAEFRKIGDAVLIEHGIKEINPAQFYPSALRRAIHSAIFERFGSSGIFWIGLETPSKFSTLFSASSEGHQDSETAEEAKCIDGPSSRNATDNKFRRLVNQLLEHLNDIIKGSIRGAPPAFGWAIKTAASTDDFTYRIHNYSVSKQDHEAFNRGRLYYLLRKNTANNWNFQLNFVAKDSEDYDGYSRCAFDLTFKPMPLGATHEILLQNERWIARDNLLKQALDHALIQEERASQALSTLAKNHHQTMESIRYAAILQKNQLPKAERWKGQVTDLSVKWAPRDVIGGDIWWFGKPRSDGVSALSLIDCTGHGVPGAMLAVLVSNSLERLHLADPYLSPSAAIAGLQAALAQSFPRTGHGIEIDNGCEIIYLNIDFEHLLIEMAMCGIGAILHRHSSGTLERFQSPKSGLTANPDSLNGVQVSQISFEKGDRLLLVTDGVTDQIGGGGAPRTFGFKRLQDAYLETVGMELNRAVDYIFEKHERWQGDNFRRDDMTLICVEL